MLYRIIFFLFLTLAHQSGGPLLSREPPTLSRNFIKQSCEFSFILDYFSYDTDHFWNKDGDRKKAFNSLNQKQVNAYVEFGITDYDTIGIYGNYTQNIEEMNGNKRGIGDFELCWKHLFWSREGHYISSRVLVIVPTGPKKTTIRYGEAGVEFDIHYQRDLCILNRSAWFEVMGGYRAYSGFPSDQIRGHAVFGYQPFSNFTFIGELQLDYGVYNGENTFHGPILYLAPQYRLLTGQVQCVYNILECLSIFAGYSQNLWGENIGTGGGWFGGISLDY